jgi:integrase
LLSCVDPDRYFAKKREEANQKRHGWHAFRRGLSTNLLHLKVPDKTIQAILRHENVATTQKHYILNVSADTVTAMKALEAEMCAECAPLSPPLYSKYNHSSSLAP